MATIVRLRNNGAHAVLLGVGYGQYSSATPSALFGNLSSNTRSGSSPMAAISGPDGTIHWHPTENLEVLSVDGMSPAEALSKTTPPQPKL